MPLTVICNNNSINVCKRMRNSGYFRNMTEMVKISAVPFDLHITQFKRLFARLNQTRISFTYMNIYNLIDMIRALDYFHIVLTPSEKHALSNCLHEEFNKLTIRQLVNIRNYTIMPDEVNIIDIWRTAVAKIIKNRRIAKWLNIIYKTLVSYNEHELIAIWHKHVFEINVEKYADNYYYTIRRVDQIPGAEIDWQAMGVDYDRYDDGTIRKYVGRNRMEQRVLFCDDAYKTEFYEKNYVIAANESFFPYFNYKTKNKYITTQWQKPAADWKDHPLYALNSILLSTF